MPTQQHYTTQTAKNIFGYPHIVYTERSSRSWDRSPKVNGVLRLRGNGMLRDTAKCIGFSFQGNESTGLPMTANGVAAFTPSITSTLESTSYARLRGRLYKGSAALGVTLASYKQSREMIVQHYHRINNKIETAARILGRVGNNRRAAARAAAGTHLEFIFGVVPIYSDVVAVLTTLAQQADSLTYVRGAHKVVIDSKEVSRWAGVTTTNVVKGHARMTQACGVRIANPNRWLLERAGLLNPATVAWDVVPWSFLVNMFVNVNALVQQFTDFAGLEFDNITVTRHARYTQYTEAWTPTFQSSIGFEVDYKSRAVGSLARPSMLIRLPDANWGLAAMAASLATQNIGKVNRLINLITTK